MVSASKRRPLEAELLREVLEHGFVTTPTNRPQPRIHEGPTRHRLFHIPVAAVKLHALSRNAHTHVHGEYLRCSDERSRVLTCCNFSHCRLVELSSCLQLDPEIRHFELRVLHLGKRLPKNNALLAPLLGFFPEILDRGQIRDTRNQTLMLKLHHLLLKPAPNLADGINNGNSDIFEIKLPGIRTPKTNFFEKVVTQTNSLGRDNDL